jgi:hypothetical protein
MIKGDKEQYLENGVNSSDPLLVGNSGYNSRAPGKSSIVARGVSPTSTEENQLFLDGIPGAIFQRGEPNPDVFYQGDDVIYDVYLFFRGKPVTTDDYEIVVSVKPSPRAINDIWRATSESGLSEVKTSGAGYFEIWIPSQVTSEILAGSYYITVWVKEKFAATGGKYDRSSVILTHIFNITYSAFSPKPETASSESFEKIHRTNLEKTWPPHQSTI